MKKANIAIMVFITAFISFSAGKVLTAKKYANDFSKAYISTKSDLEAKDYLILALEKEVIELCLANNNSKNAFVKCDNSITYIDNFLSKNEVENYDNYKIKLRERIAKENFFKNLEKENNNNKGE